MTSVKEECPEVHIRACSCSLPNDRIESAKERKLAMLIQATVMINAKQSGIGERQRGRHQLAYYFRFTFKVSGVELCLYLLN